MAPNAFLGSKPRSETATGHYMTARPPSTSRLARKMAITFLRIQFDQAISWIGQIDVGTPDKCFFCSFGATHAPLHVLPGWIAPYRAAFDHGWNQQRDLTLPERSSSRSSHPLRRCLHSRQSFYYGKTSPDRATGGVPTHGALCELRNARRRPDRPTRRFPLRRRAGRRCTC